MVSGMGAGGAGGRVVGQTTGARGLRHAPRDDAAGRASFITGGGFARRTHLYSHEIAIHGLVLSVHFACYGRVRAGAVGGAREAMTRAEWDKVALTPRIEIDSCQWAGHPGLRGMAGPRRRISRRVLPLLLIIGVLGLGSRVLGPHPGGGVDGDGAATTADPGSHHRSSASNDENLGGAVVVVKPGVNDDTVHVDAFDSPLPPLPRRVRSKPPPSRAPPAGGAERGRDTKKDEGTTGRQGTKKLVAGTAALTVDQRTHAADTDAAKAIANAGKQTSGYADALSTDKIVFATFVSNGFHEFMLNW